MSKLVILRGLPASGKSTKALQLVQAGYKRINADDLRNSIDNGIYSKSNEQTINNLMNHMLDTFLSHNYNVVLDNNNLNPWKVRSAIDIASKYPSIEIEVLDITTSLEVCLQRDLERTHGRVGKEVITEMHDTWLIEGEFPLI